MLGSSFWNGYLTSFLAQAYILRKEFSNAKVALETILQQEQQPSSVIERQVAFVWGELALAQGESARALAIAEQLIVSAPGDARPQPIPRLIDNGFPRTELRGLEIADPFEQGE